MAIARYTLAVNRGHRREQGDNGADFINCVVFRKGAEFAEKYLHQGTKLLVTGRIRTGSYTNKDGQKVYTTDVIVDEQEFAEKNNFRVTEAPCQNRRDIHGYSATESKMRDFPLVKKKG